MNKVRNSFTFGIGLYFQSKFDYLKTTPHHLLRPKKESKKKAVEPKKPEVEKKKIEDDKIQKAQLEKGPAKPCASIH